MATTSHISAEKEICQKADNLIFEAKQYLMLLGLRNYHSAFLGSLLYTIPTINTWTVTNPNMRKALVGSVDTAGTDGLNIYYNPKYIQTMNKQNVIFILAHEIMHVILEHCASDKLCRRGGRDFMLYNYAGDYVINKLLKQAQIGEKRPEWLYDRKYNDNSWTTEKVYDDIKHLSPQTLENRGVLLDQHGLEEFLSKYLCDKDGNSLSSEEIENIRNEIHQKIVESHEQAKVCDRFSIGNMPGNNEQNALRDFMDSLFEPHINWRAYIKSKIQTQIVANHSYLKYNKKSTSGGCIIPGRIKDEMIKIHVAVDTSGSVEQIQLTAFLSEIYNIVCSFGEYELDIWTFDTSVKNHKCFSNTTNSAENKTNILSYIFKGGGGTDFMANWEYMKSEKIVPELFVLFTDGYPCGRWGVPGYCETIFLIANCEKGSTIVAPPEVGITINYSMDI